MTRTHFFAGGTHTKGSFLLVGGRRTDCRVKEALFARRTSSRNDGLKKRAFEVQQWDGSWSGNGSRSGAHRRPLEFLLSYRQDALINILYEKAAGNLGGDVRNK